MSDSTLEERLTLYLQLPFRENAGWVSAQLVPFIEQEKQQAVEAVLEELWIKKPPYGRAQESEFQAGYEVAAGEIQDKINKIRQSYTPKS